MYKIDEIKMLQLGQRDENLAREIQMDASDWLELYPGASIQILFRRPGESTITPMISTLIDGVLTWQIHDFEVGKTGVGNAEIRAVDTAGLRRKSRIIPCSIEETLLGDDETVLYTQDQVDITLAHIGEAAQAAIAAKASEDAAALSAQEAADAAGSIGTAVEDTREYKEAAEQAAQNAQTAQEGAEAAERDVHADAEAAEQAKVAAQAAQAGAQGAASQASAARAAAETAQADAEAAAAHAEAVVEGIDQAGADQVAAVNAAGATQVGNVNAAGTTQVNAVQAKGTQVIASIPADYSALTDEVTDLKSALDANSKKLENKVDGAKTANLFDKSTIIEGYYAGANGLVEAEGWNASDYIEVEAGKTYSASVISNARYYDSGYTRTGNIAVSPFTVPSGVKYVRFSIQDANVNTFMCVLGSTLPDSYIPYGCVLSMNSFTDEIITELKDIMGVPDGLIDDNYLHHLREHLSNPFIRTQIKFVGDSITAGQGGTGYDASGTSGVLIGGTESSYQNVTSAICFSNMLYHFIADRYNQKIDVSVADERIDKPYIGKSSTLAKGTKTIGSFKIEYDRLTENNTIASRDFLSFSFYGTAFSIFNFKGNNKGKYGVYCDGTLLDTIDCYSATTEERYEQTFTGLTEGTHTVVLKTTATKNASSTLNQIVITGIAVTKHAVVVPWGISGTLSASAINTTGRYTTDDDFVILQYGTNDRHMYFSQDSTYENLISAAEIIKETYGAEPIFMCPPPVDESFEYDVSVTRYYHMWDVHDAVCRVGEYYKIPVIDNYKAFMDYLDNHDNATLDDLLFDGLHPNDLGYAVIYDNIMNSLGLPKFPAYKAWPQSE